MNLCPPHRPTKWHPTTLDGKPAHYRWCEDCGTVEWKLDRAAGKEAQS